MPPHFARNLSIQSVIFGGTKEKVLILFYFNLKSHSWGKTNGQKPYRMEKYNKPKNWKIFGSSKLIWLLHENIYSLDNLCILPIKAIENCLLRCFCCSPASVAAFARRLWQNFCIGNRTKIKVWLSLFNITICSNYLFWQLPAKTNRITYNMLSAKKVSFRPK